MPSHKTATVLLSLLLSLPAYAVDEVSEIDVCKDMSIIAKEIMTARQKNKPMSETLPFAIDRINDLMDKYGVEEDAGGNFEEAAAQMVMGAYESRAHDNDRMAQTEISNFENGAFQACYEASTSEQAVTPNEMPAYQFALQQKVLRNWARPSSARAGLDCVVEVRQSATGEVISANVVSCNGDAAVERSIEAAVYKASPLPLPENAGLFDPDLRFRFMPEQ